VFTTDVAGGVIHDACGRSRYFRGLNVVYKGAPWYPQVTGFDPALSMSAADGALWQSLGMNAARLGVMWPGVVPAPGAVDGGYLRIMTNLTSMLGGYGIYSLLDMHQDAVAGLFCGEGFPDWAAAKYSAGAQPFPLPLTSTPFPINATTGEPTAAACATIDWSECYFADAAGKATQALYSNVNGSAADFEFFWATVAAAWVGADHILGYELMNEPWAGDVLADPALLVPGVADRLNLQPLWMNTTAALRAAEAPGVHRLVFVEGVTWDDFLPVGFDVLPGATDGLAVLSYHYYDLPNFDPDWQATTRLADATRLGAVAMLTEFDFGTSNLTYLSDMMATWDKYGQGYLGWEYKSFVPITGANSGLFTPAGALDLVKSAAMARTFPFAVAGTGAAYGFDYTTGVFSLTYTQNANASAPTEVFLSTAFWYTAGAPGVQLTSVPAGAATWSITYFNGTTAAAAAANPAPPGVAPTPFAWALLTVTANTSAPITTTAGAIITLVVSP